MLSYRHEYHAGNAADLIKHSTLTLIIEYLKRKPAPIRYIDTHAGAGLYSTRSAMAAKTKEYDKAAGVLATLGFPPEFASYEAVLSRYTPTHQYPGSPLIAASLLRSQDHLRLFELHSTDYPLLKELFATDRRVRTTYGDGYESLKALLPVNNARALVLIDPSYETRADYEKVVQSIKQGYTRMPHAVFAVWYPVVGNRALDVMIKNLESLVSQKLWRYELTLTGTDKTDSANTDAAGMTATGMLVINPPWTLEADLNAGFSRICPQLTEYNARFTATCLKD